MNRFSFSVGSTTFMTLAPITRKTAASAAVSSPTLENAPQVLETDPVETLQRRSSQASRSPSPVAGSQQGPNSPSLRRSPSVSSSDSDAPPRYKKAHMSSSNALLPSVEHSSLHHAPILTAGVLTPALLLEFEDACQDFFANAKGGVANEVKVTRILPGFKDPIIRGWISSDRAHLSSLTFAAFMSTIRSKFLSKQWEDELLSSILRNHLTPNQDFLTWATKLQQQNCILRNTPSQLDEKRLREQISVAVDGDLRIAAREAKVNEATSLREFLDIYTLCDEKRKASEKRTRSLIEESYRNKRSNKENAFHPYKKDTPSTQSSSSSSRPPKLTAIEIEIIKACSGCFKCRKLYLSKEHIHAEPGKKTCNFPSGENYRALTWDYANKVKQFRASKKTSSAPNPVAATSSNTLSASSSSNPSTGSSSSIIEMNTSDDSNFVASMFGPLASAAVLGNGSFSSESDSSVRQPFKSKHYVWKCTINGPADEFPVKFSTLIDNGAHMVFIRPDTVTKLGLPSYPLPQPEVVDVAISSSTTTQKTLSHFVKFKATSLDGLWTSRTVYAIITPGLCMPIIFGLPFLEFNGIISDHSLRACIHKNSGYNLLHPVLPPPKVAPKPKLKEQLKANRIFKSEALKELISTYNDKWGSRLPLLEIVKPFDKLKAVKTRICSIINTEILNRKEQKIMKEFHSVFEPIPHYDKLPTDVEAKIKLIDPSKPIKTRNYPCPRKYKEAWHTLIQQHLKNGIIRHSSSPFASPAFIIPKADPAVLPRWVNDYRQLNENTVTDSHPLPRIDDILNDCAKGKIWSKLDMTNSFFQTRMHPEHIPYTAVSVRRSGS